MGTLAIDASSPATNYNGAGTSVSCSSFTPPAGSLLVAALRYNTGSGDTPGTPTCSGGSLTWTLKEHGRSPDTPSGADGALAIFTAVGAGASMTVTAGSTGTAATGAALKVQVWTDSSGGTPGIGTIVKGGSISGTASVGLSILGTVAGSRACQAVVDWDATGAPTAGANTTMTGGDSVNQAPNLSYCLALSTTNDGAVGVSDPLVINLGGASSNVRWIGYEVTPATTTAVAYDSYGQLPPGRIHPAGTFTQIPGIVDTPATNVDATAEQTTHDVTTGDPSPSVGITDGTNPATTHTTNDPTPSTATSAADGVTAHTTNDPTAGTATTDTTAPATTHTTNAPTTSLGVSDTPPAIGHQTADVTSTQTTTDTTAPANAHTTAQPAPALSVLDVTAPSIGHQTFDATTSTATLTNVNAELTNHAVTAGDVSNTQTTTTTTATHTVVAPDATTALTAPSGQGTTSHTTGDALAALTPTDTTAPATAHTSGDVTATTSTTATDPVIGHTTYDATTSTASLVNATAELANHTQVVGDPTTIVASTVGAGGIGHQTFDATPSTTATTPAGGGANTHTTAQPVANIGGPTQNVSHTFTTTDVTTTQTTQAPPTSVALTAFDATVQTALPPVAYIGVDTGLSWTTVDNPQTVIDGDIDGTARIVHHDTLLTATGSID